MRLLFLHLDVIGWDIGCCSQLRVIHAEVHLIRRAVVEGLMQTPAIVEVEI